MNKISLWFKRLCLRLVFGKRTYLYMCMTMQAHSTKGAHFCDIVIRKGGRDYRVEADWLKKLDNIVRDVKKPSEEMYWLGMKVK